MYICFTTSNLLVSFDLNFFLIFSTSGNKKWRSFKTIEFNVTIGLRVQPDTIFSMIQKRKVLPQSLTSTLLKTYHFASNFLQPVFAFYNTMTNFYDVTVWNHVSILIWKKNPGKCALKLAVFLFSVHFL